MYQNSSWLISKRKSSNSLIFEFDQFVIGGIKISRLSNGHQKKCRCPDEVFHVKCWSALFSVAEFASHLTDFTGGARNHVSLVERSVLHPYACPHGFAWHGNSCRVSRALRTFVLDRPDIDDSILMKKNPCFGNVMYPLWDEGENGEFFYCFPRFCPRRTSPFWRPCFGFGVPISGWLPLFWEQQNGSN